MVNDLPNGDSAPLGRFFFDDDMPYIDPDVQAGWVAEQTGLDIGTVRTVLDLELEYMAGVGIAIPPLDYQFRFYHAGELDDVPRCVDTLWLARDVERITGIAQAIAHRVFEAELRFLQRYGLTG